MAVMKTFEHFDQTGHLRAFEISNLWLGRRGVVKIVRTIPGVTILKVPQRMDSKDAAGNLRRPRKPPPDHPIRASIWPSGAITLIWQARAIALP